MYVSTILIIVMWSSENKNTDMYNIYIYVWIHMHTYAYEFYIHKCQWYIMHKSQMGHRGKGSAVSFHCFHGNHEPTALAMRWSTDCRPQLISSTECGVDSLMSMVRWCIYTLMVPSSIHRSIYRSVYSRMSLCMYTYIHVYYIIYIHDMHM